MLPIKNRLTKRQDFASVYLTGAYAANSGISIKYLETKFPVVRIGFSVGKTFSKKATERNRARRILREATGKQLASLRPGFDIIFMLQGKQRELILEQVATITHKLFTKARLLK